VGLSIIFGLRTLVRTWGIRVELWVVRSWRCRERNRRDLRFFTWVLGPLRAEPC
jgi:hypothetical protein